MNILDAEQEFFTIPEIAKFLGMSYHTVRGWVLNGNIPSYSFADKGYKIRKTDLIHFIEASRNGVLK